MLVFWVVMSYEQIPLFGGTYFLHPQTEDGGSMFLSNVGTYYKSSECYNLEDQHRQWFRNLVTFCNIVKNVG